MKRIIIATISFVLTMLLLALINWFEIESGNIDKINKKHLSEIERLNKIAKINTWLDTVIQPHIASLPTNKELADHNLVKYFDLYSKNLHFRVSHYIYGEDNLRNLDIEFTLQREQKKHVLQLMQLQYAQGFLQFNTLEVNKEKIKGELHLIQPFYGENNASHE